VDSQKHRVYAWETAFRSFNENNTPRRRLRRLIRRAERRYRIPPSKIIFTNRVHRAKRYAKIASEYDPDVHSITLGHNDQNYAIALHETAHAIVDTLLGYDLEPHGPQWLGVYLELLEWAKVAPREALHARAKAYGLDWIPAGRIGPKAIRRAYRGMMAKRVLDG